MSARLCQSDGALGVQAGMDCRVDDKKDVAARF
jgi:hypothetical protein